MAYNWPPPPPVSPYVYAQLPIYHYQTFDRQNVKFSNIPIIPPNPKPPVIDKETNEAGKDADILPKKDQEPGSSDGNGV